MQYVCAGCLHFNISDLLYFCLYVSEQSDIDVFLAFVIRLYRYRLH